MKTNFSFFFLLIPIVVSAQVTTFVQAFGSPDIEQVGGLQVSSQDEVYVAGTFGDDMNIDNSLLPISGLEDIFLIKKDANGQLIWSKKYGSNDRDKVTGVRLFNDTTLFFSGIFWDNISFDSFSLSANGSAAFITKSDTSGHIIWAKVIDGNGLLKVNEGVVDAQGNYIFTGSFSGDLYFPNVTLTAEGVEDGFLAKYDKDGNFLWANRFGFQQQTIATSVAADDLGSIFVGGQFNGRVIFGNDTLWASANDFDIFLARYDDNGSLQFGKRFGGIYDDINPKIGVGSNGKVVMAGTFIGLLNLDNQSIQTNSNVDADIFLATFTQNASLLTVNQYGGTNNETLVNLTVKEDDYFLSGYYDTFTEIDEIQVPLSPLYLTLKNLLIRTNHNELTEQANVISYFNFDKPSSTVFAAPHVDFSNEEVTIAGIFQGAINLPIAIPSPVSNGFTDIFLVTMSLPPVSTLSLHDQLTVSLFPNPASDIISIDLNGQRFDSSVVIEVINTIGQVEERLMVTNTSLIQVPIYHLPKGIKFLRIKVGTEEIVRQFVKQ